MHIVGYATLKDVGSGKTYTDSNSLTGCEHIGTIPVYCRNKTVTSSGTTKYLTELYVLAGPNASDGFELSDSDVDLEMDIVLTYYCKEFEGATT
jgi:hypothetical protein